MQYLYVSEPLLVNKLTKSKNIKIGMKESLKSKDHKFILIYDKYYFNNRDKIPSTQKHIMLISEKSLKKANLFLRKSYKINVIGLE